MKGIADGKGRADLVEQVRGLLKSGDMTFETVQKHFAESGVTLAREVYAHARLLMRLADPISMKPRTAAKPPRNSSVQQKVLTAARELEGEIPLAKLIVACWEKYPVEFGLSPDYHFPCSNKVISVLSGKRGLVARGWLERVAPNVYRVTEEGKNMNP